MPNNIPPSEVSRISALDTLLLQAASKKPSTFIPIIPASSCSVAPIANPGSRRRRLWELNQHAYCPVVGVCMPMAAFLRLVTKATDRKKNTDDDELHCAVIADCKVRTPVGDAMQRELDRRYATCLRQAALAKTTDALAAWWDQSLRTHDVAGALWATLTHARCTPELEYRVLAEVHMLQHQVGMATRVDLDRFEALIDENAVLSKELAAAQQRSMRQTAEQARRAEDQQVQIMQLRAHLIARDTAIGHLRDDLQALESAIPGMKARFELTRENQRQLERLQEAERAAGQAQQEADRQRRRADELAMRLQFFEAREAEPLDESVVPSSTHALLDAQAVLCVGGRTAAVPLYRDLIEKVGGRFLHHDGGEEESSGRLEATLAAADMVICQTGCISHNAYWRVKDHCKRTGKRCVFVESPSTAGIKRALIALAPTLNAEPAFPK